MPITQAEIALRGKDETAAAFRSVVRNAETAGRQIDSKLKSAVKFAAGGFIAFQLGRMVAESAKAGESLINLAERTGRTVESVSQLQFISERAGVSFEALTKGQDQLAKRLGATDEEGKAAAKALSELGLSANPLRALSFDERLNAIADAMGAISDPTQRARLEMALLGKSGTELDHILRDGAGGLRDLREEADRLGGTISELEAKRLAALDDQLDRTTAQYRKMKLEIVGIIAQPLGAYFDLVGKGALGWRAMFGATGDQLEETNQQITDLQSQLAKLTDAQKHWDNSDRTKDRIAQIKEYLNVLRETQEQILRTPAALAKWERMSGDINAKKQAEAEAAALKLEAEAKAAAEAAKEFAKLAQEIAAVIEQEKLMNSLEIKYPTPLLDKNTFKRELESTDEMVQDVSDRTERVFEGMFEGLAEDFKGASDKLSVFAEEGARNIQGYLANFLFDPFKDGISGMLQGWIDVLRRMVAEAASAKILEALGLGSPGGGILGSILGGLFGGFTSGAATAGASAATGSGGGWGGGFARGGFLGPGQWGMAGEEGPEPIFGGRTGMTVIPHGSGGGSVHVEYKPVINIDSRSDRAAIMRDVMAITQQGSAQTEARVIEGIRRNRYQLSPA